MPATTPYQCLTLSLLLIPPLLLISYFFAQFPHAPQGYSVHPSLASLGPETKAKDIYPEDYYTGGAYVSLPFGRVRYWLMGPENGKKIVLIHGLSVPSLIWKDVAPALASRGFRVLMYDLYGRGYSDAPEITYDASLYATQLALLMQHVKWPKANIAGVSMGGGILAAFTAYFPDLVDAKVALIAPTGLVESGDLSRTTKFMSSPFIQTVTSSAPFRFYLQRLANSSSSDPVSEIVRIQSAHLPGYNAAIASSLRDGPIRGLHESFEALGASEREVLLIWGTADNTVPHKYAARMQSLLPQSELVTIQDGGHDLTVSHPETIVSAFVRFLGSKH
ncbi:alpha/beta-hydrolase [Gloeopeniophorella convolvens]|nr:alpha/beta-hydrolase [Gloeopeniophorella convolvens]